MDHPVSIRVFQNSDAESLASLANNQKIADNLRDYFPSPYGINDANEFIDMLLKAKPTNTFAVCYHGELAGVMGFIPKDDVYRHSAEVGYWLGEKFWGKGIATTALKMVVRYAFEELEIKRLYTAVFEGNEGSKRVLEKAGFFSEAIGIKSVFKNGEYLDEYRYGLLNPTFFPNNT